MKDNMIEWKVLYMFGLFLSTFLSFLTPIIIIRKQQQKLNNHNIDSANTYQLLSVCNCLSVGLFLGICFLDLIPYAEREFNEIFKISKVEVNFPVGQFIVIIGVLLVLTLEIIIKQLLAKASPPFLKLDDENSNKMHEKQDKQELIEVSTEDKETEKFIVEKESTLQLNACHHCFSHLHNIDVNEDYSYLSFSLLIFAKSIHSIFEGLALGLLNDEQIALHLFIGVLLHECLIGFALGLNSQRIECQMKTSIKLAIVFSITIPIGILLGIVLAYTPGQLGRFISAVFQALAAGTFIHVTFNELIPSEFISSESYLNITQKLVKIFLLFIGFCFMAIITVLTEESN